MEKRNQSKELSNKNIKEISRRDFVIRTALVGAGLALDNYCCNDKT